MVMHLGVTFDVYTQGILNSLEADMWPSTLMIKCSYVVFCDKKYMCDPIANYGFSVSIQSNRRTVNTSVLHSTVNIEYSHLTDSGLMFVCWLVWKKDYRSRQRFLKQGLSGQ